MRTRVLSHADIVSIIQKVGLNALMDELMERLANAFTKLDAKRAQIPPRSGIHYENPDLGLLEWMPASVDTGQASLKIVGYHPTNPQKRSLPTILSSIGIFDTTTGHLDCLLDGTFSTALRTGAMSAVASQLMTKPQDGMTLGIVGCGAQAVTQVHALSRAFDIKSIIAYDISEQASRSLERRIAFTGITVQSVSVTDFDSLLTQSDILCTCTSADPGSGPLFRDFNNKPELHINAVGSDFPTKIELPLSLLKRSFVCPDFLEQAKAEGECQQMLEQDIDTDLTGLFNSSNLQDKAKAGLSVFDSTGHAYSDYVTSLLIRSYAAEMKLGTLIEIESVPPDPKDPYSFLAQPSASIANAGPISKSTC